MVVFVSVSKTTNTKNQIWSSCSMFVCPLSIAIDRLAKWSGTPCTVSTPRLGPLLALEQFQPSTLRWCLMHTLHLGLLYVANGATMQLGLVTFCCAPNISCVFLRFFVKSSWWCGLKWKHNASNKQHQVTTLLDPLWRHLLIKLGFWGQKANLSECTCTEHTYNSKSGAQPNAFPAVNHVFKRSLCQGEISLRFLDFPLFSTWLLKIPKVTHRFFGKLTLHIQCSWVVYENGWDSAPLQSLQWSSSDAVAYWDCCSSSWNRALQISWWYYIHCGPGHAS